MASGDTRKVILENKDGEYLIPFTEVASSTTVGRVKPDGTSTSVDANGVISVIGKQDTISDLATIRSGAAAGATAAQPGDIGNAEIEIQKNGTKIDSFTANQSGSKKTINITVPTSAADISALPSSTKYGASITVSLNTTDYKLTTTLKDQDGNTLGTAQVVDFPIESVVVNGSYDSTNKKIVLTLQNGNTVDIPIADLISGLQSEITSSNKLDADLVDDSTSTNKFVTASDKTTWSGKQDALTSANAGTGISISGSGSNVVISNTQTSAEWGNITGTLADQTDLNTALGAKYDASNPAGYTSNIGTVTSVNNISPVNGNVTIIMPTVDQSYSASSTNAQSGTAVSGAISGKQDTLVSGTNIKTVNSQSLLGSGDITISGTVTRDNLTITENASQELQTVGVIDSNNTTNAIKTWTGTKAQYDAIVTKDQNTLYNITDDTSSVDIMQTILSSVYPVGSVYITTANTCPLSTLISGSTWTLRSSRVVTSVNTNVPCKGNGMTLGLTNGTTNYGIQPNGGVNSLIGRSATYGNNIGTSTTGGSVTSGSAALGVTTDASKSGIVGTVTRSTLSVNIFERTS